MSKKEWMRIALKEKSDAFKKFKEYRHPVNSLVTMTPAEIILGGGSTKGIGTRNPENPVDVASTVGEKDLPPSRKKAAQKSKESRKFC